MNSCMLMLWLLLDMLLYAECLVDIFAIFVFVNYGCV